MLTQDQKAQFYKDGFVLVPNMLTAERVNQLRAFFRPKFDVPPEQRFLGDTDKILFDIYSHYSEVRWLLFHEPTIKVLRSLLGKDFVVLRETAVHFQQFGGWHKDTTSQENAGHMFHWQNNYLMVEVAYYLQDNSVEYGGGLDVEPGSHRKTDLFVTHKSPNKLQRVWSHLSGRRDRSVRNVLSIPSKAGDLVIFDFRINHRATPTQQTEVAIDREKIAIFWACSANTPDVQAYHDFIHSRPSYVYLQNFSYPADLLHEARERGINLP